MLDLGSHYAHWSFGVGGGAGCFVEYGYTKAEEFTWRALLADYRCQVQSKFNTIGNIILW